MVMIVSWVCSGQGEESCTVCCWSLSLQTYIIRFDWSVANAFTAIAFELFAGSYKIKLHLPAKHQVKIITTCCHSRPDRSLGSGSDD